MSADLPPPLVPAEVNLTDFAFMPLEVRRLLTSDTWVLGSGDERAAAMCLWLQSWHQVPAGSLPRDDRMLSHLAQCKVWRRCKDHALRGWTACRDGRLYHRVVAEKVLEAWLEKLAQRISSGEGNRKRWGIAFDRAWVDAAMEEARWMLAALNPQSRALTKKRTAGIQTGQESHQDSHQDSRQDSRQESRRDRKGQGQGQGQGQGSNGVLSHSSEQSKSPTRRGAMARALRDKGVQVTPSHPLLVAWVDQGVTVEKALEAVTVARGRKPAPEQIPTAYLDPIIAELVGRNGHVVASAVREKPWFIRSSTAVEEKGRELKVAAIDGEAFPYFRDRVFKAAGVTEDMVQQAEADYR